MELATAPIGARVTFAEERMPYTVQARSERYLVCTKPFAPQKTVIYTVVDLDRGIRGPENLVFGFGAETREQCEDMLDRLEGRADYKCDPSEVSYRNHIPVHVAKVKLPT